MGALSHVDSGEQPMKKPLNKFALALWVLAAIYAAFQVWLWFYFARMDREIIALDMDLLHLHQKELGGQLPHLSQFLSTPPNLVLEIAVLASLGMLIEIGDKIRWLLERRPDQHPNVTSART
jgi:hypothetical protein